MKVSGARAIRVALSAYSTSVRGCCAEKVQGTYWKILEKRSEDQGREVKGRL